MSLNVLRQGQRHHPCIGLVKQHAHRFGQRCQQLLWPGDAVEKAADRPETIIDTLIG